MITAMKRARERARVERLSGKANKQDKGEGWQEGWRRRQKWWATNRAMPMATKRAMVTNGNNTGNGYGKEGGRHSTVATMGTAQRTHPLVL